jgi:hypothetical protein
MAWMRRKSSHDKDIERGARELGINEATLRQWMDTADDEELMKRAVELAGSRGRGAETTARVLGINEEALRRHLWFYADGRRREAAARGREELRKQRPHYLEYPPS